MRASLRRAWRLFSLASAQASALAAAGGGDGGV